MYISFVYYLLFRMVIPMWIIRPSVILKMILLWVTIEEIDEMRLTTLIIQPYFAILKIDRFTANVTIIFIDWKKYVINRISNVCWKLIFYIQQVQRKSMDWSTAKILWFSTMIMLLKKRYINWMIWHGRF